LQWLKEAIHHPAQYLEKDQAIQYSRYKKEISSYFSKEKDPGKRRDIHRKLKQIDREMLDLLNNKIIKKRAEIQKQEKILKYKEVLLERKYPCFLYYNINDLKVGLERNIEINYFAD